MALIGAIAHKYTDVDIVESDVDNADLLVVAVSGKGTEICVWMSLEDFEDS